MGETRLNTAVIPVAALATIAIVGATFAQERSEIKEEPQSSELVEDSRYLRVGAWNIKKLGHGEKKDYSSVARIIDGHFDVLAVVEVMQEKREYPGFDNLLGFLGKNWDGIVTSEPRPNTNSGNAEYYAIFYRNNRVAMCDDWIALVHYEDNDGSGTEQTLDKFAREPAYACFHADRKGEKTGFDFILAAYHARWNGGNKDEIAEEVANIPEVFAAMLEAREDEKDIILAGDFNLNPDRLGRVTKREITISGNSSTLNTHGELTGNIYDYVLVHDPHATTEMREQPRIIDVRSEVGSNLEFFENISDHLPVVAIFLTGRPDDD